MARVRALGRGLVPKKIRRYWQYLVKLAKEEKVTIGKSTHVGRVRGDDVLNGLKSVLRGLINQEEVEMPEKVPCEFVIKDDEERRHLGEELLRIYYRVAKEKGKRLKVIIPYRGKYNCKKAIDNFSQIKDEDYVGRFETKWEEQRCEIELVITGENEEIRNEKIDEVRRKLKSVTKGEGEIKVAESEIPFEIEYDKEELEKIENWRPPVYKSRS